MGLLGKWSGSKVAALLSTLAALAVAATFFQWSDILVDGGMRLRRWVKVLLLAVASVLMASAIVPRRLAGLVSPLWRLGSATSSSPPSAP